MQRYPLGSFYTFIIAICVIFSSWIIYFRPTVEILAFFTLLAIILIIVRVELIKGLKGKQFWLLAIFLGYVWIPKNVAYDSFSFNLLLNFVFILVLFLLSAEVNRSVYEMIRMILFFIIAIGLSFHVLDIFNIYRAPRFDTFLDLSGRRYLIYPLYVKEIIDVAIYRYKFQSIFDEPGYLGTIIFFILLIEDFNFQKKSNVVFLFAGIFSVSLAFYLFTLVFYAIKIFNFKDLRSALILFFSFLVFNYMFSFVVKEGIFDRFELVDSGIAGDSRGGFYEQVESVKSLLKQDSFFLLFGNGMSAYIKAPNIYHRIADSTWARLVHQIGVIPLILFIYLLYSIVENNKKAKLFLLFFCISIYQRPQIIEPFMMMLLFSSTGNMGIAKGENLIVATKTKYADNI